NPRLLIEAYRKSSIASTVNTAPASALAFAANKSFITMTVGLLTTESPTATSTSFNQSNSSSENRPSILRECDEALLIDQL
ncbi:unnamed protein product, partial [Rotaria socialis]